MFVLGPRICVEDSDDEDSFEIGSDGVVIQVQIYNFF